MKRPWDRWKATWQWNAHVPGLSVLYCSTMWPRGARLWVSRRWGFSGFTIDTPSHWPGPEASTHISWPWRCMGFRIFVSSCGWVGNMERHWHVEKSCYSIYWPWCYCSCRNWRRSIGDQTDRNSSFRLREAEWGDCSRLERGCHSWQIVYALSRWRLDWWSSWTWCLDGEEPLRDKARFYREGPGPGLVWIWLNTMMLNYICALAIVRWRRPCSCCRQQAFRSIVHQNNSPRSWIAWSCTESSDRLSTHPHWSIWLGREENIRPLTSLWIWSAPL